MQHARVQEFSQLYSLQGMQSIRPTSLLTLTVSAGVSKTTLTFDLLLEELTELTESYYTQGNGLLQRKDKD